MAVCVLADAVDSPAVAYESVGSVCLDGGHDSTISRTDVDACVSEERGVACDRG